MSIKEKPLFNLHSHRLLSKITLHNINTNITYNIPYSTTNIIIYYYSKAR